MKHYYNDNAAHSVKWLHHLMNENLIEEGIIDERSITDVRPGDVAGFTQCHWFAGIAGWSYALQLAGWPPDIPVWTASLPCQPFSVVGRKKGFIDERHLWPVFRNLVEECRPGVVFGEQVGASGGRDWFAAVQHEMAEMGYASAAVIVPACSVGAPHIRQRLFWVAYAYVGTEGLERGGGGKTCTGRAEESRAGSRRRGKNGGVVHSGGIAGRDAPTGKDAGKNEERNADTTEGPGSTGRMADAANEGGRQRIGGSVGQVETRRPGASGGMEDAGGPGLEGRGHETGAGQGGERPWKTVSLVPCADGKLRPVEPGIYPLAPGLPGRMDAIAGYGNSIVPQLAAEFIRSVMEYLNIGETKHE